MKYYLDIGGVIVKVDCPDNLFLVDEWREFFENFLGVFGVGPTKHDAMVRLVGLKTDKMKTYGSDKMSYPQIDNNLMVFDNGLHPSLFLLYLEKLVLPILVRKGGIFVHASGFVRSNKAILVTGDSGTGKSTFVENVCNKYKVLADDSIIIRTDKNGGLLAYPSPMNIKYKIEVGNKGYAVKRILSVVSFEEYGISNVSTGDAFDILINQIRLKPLSKLESKLMLNICKNMSSYFMGVSYRKGIDDVCKLVSMI